MSKAVAGRRLNLRAAIILGVVVLVAIPGLFAYKSYRERRNGSLMLREAEKRLKLEQPHLALQYLSRYLATHPDDADALDMKAKILADSVHSVPQALEAMQVHNQVLGHDPDNPKRQETRRRLVELNLKVGGRAKAAEALARELIRRGANDASAHRLLAASLEGVGADGNADVLKEAGREYESAAKLDPGDVPSAERLALLYRDRLDEPKKALETLDRLVAADRETPAKLAAAHLARSRFFASGGQPDRASAELELALKADPADVDVRLAAADAANQRGDTSAAHRHLDAIPEAERGALRIKLIEGLVELNEQRPDEAIESWRAGLVQTGGSNVDLTWRLAQVLLDIGRVREAEPLIAQYRRLVGGDEPNAFYHYLNGFALLKKGRPAEAIAELEAIRYKVAKVLEPHLYYVLGQCYERVNEPSKAIDAYHQAAKSTPQWGLPWVAIANLQLADSLDEAARTLDQGLVANPNDPRLLVNAALLLWRKQVALPKPERTWTQVEQMLDRARKAAPNSVELALVEADYRLSVDKVDDALAALERASRSNPKSAPLWLARANLLNRLGRSSQAMETLDRAIASGPQAGYSVLRASLLLSLGHVKEARAALLDDVNRVPAEQRPQIWKALGEFYAGQADVASARGAFGEWARLQPESPEPHAALFQLALNAGDESAIRAEVEALKGIGGPQAPYWRLARAEELLRDRPGASNEAGRLDEAERLIHEVETIQPHAPSGFVLEGRLWEKRRRVDRAIAAYEKALDRRGGRLALAPLVALLSREGRDEDLARVRGKVATIPADLERLATVQALKVGDKQRAEQLAALMVKGDPQGLDARVWQARVLNDLGKPQEAEAALRLLISQRPDEPAPLLQLLMLQVAQKQLKAAAETVELIRQRVKTDHPELLWAQCYRVVGDRPRADACYRDALKLRPDDLVVRTAAIDYYTQTGRAAEAEASLRHVLKRDPALSWASRKLALSLAGHESDRAAWDEALELIGPSAKPDDTPDDRLTRAQVYARGPEPQHRKQAIALLEGLASELPNAAMIQEPLARLLRDSGKADQARAHAAKAAGENATPDAILFYGGLLLAAKDLDGAEKQLARLSAIDADRPAVAELRARILEARGRGDEAVAGLERAFASQAETPQGVAVGEKMIVLLRQLKQPEAAERVARRLGTLGPRGTCAYARYLAEEGRPDAAAAELEKAAKAGDPGDAGTTALVLASAASADPRWTDLADRYLTQDVKGQPPSIDKLQLQARVRYLQHRYDDQIALYRAILDRNPSDYLFLNDMAWTLSEDLNRPAEGLERANDALRHVGPQPNLLDTRGVILTRLGRLDDAIKDLEAAASGFPIGPVYYHLARAYQKKGRQEDFRRARELAKQAGLRPEQLQPSERSDWDKVMVSP